MIKNNKIGLNVLIFLCFIIVGAIMIPIKTFQDKIIDENDATTYNHQENTICPASVGENIELLSRYDDFGTYYTFKIENDLLYIASGDIGLNIYNISNPTDPHLIGNFYNGGVVCDIELANSSIAYLLNFEKRIEIVDVSDPSNITLLNIHSIFIDDYFFNSGDLFIANNLCIFSYQSSSFDILNIDDPIHPVSIYKHEISDPEWNYEDYEISNITDNLLFHSNGSELCVYNITYPSNPEKIANFTYSDIVDFSIIDDLLYISHGLIIDVFNFSQELGFDQPKYHFVLGPGVYVKFFEITN